MITDILHAFAQNPTDPVYDRELANAARDAGPRGFVQVPSGIHAIGHEGHGFCFDNETPLHDELIPRVRIARHLVTNGEWLDFIEAGGYGTPSLWLSDGWALVQIGSWQAPGLLARKMTVPGTR